MGKSEVKIPLGRARRKGKDKAVPLQAQRGPEGSRKLMFQDFVTTSQDGGKVVRTRRRWENYSKYAYLLMKCDGTSWNGSSWLKWQDLVKPVMYVPSGSVD